MAKKKKNINRGPRRKRMKREARLQSAVHWIKKYSGKNLIRGYKNWYGIDEICAITELRLLGIQISEDRLELAKHNLENRINQKQILRKKKREKELEFLYQDSDDTFFYIAGYTSGGVPYGVTWEEMGETPPDWDE